MDWSGGRAATFNNRAYPRQATTTCLVRFDFNLVYSAQQQGVGGGNTKCFWTKVDRQRWSRVCLGRLGLGTGRGFTHTGAVGGLRGVSLSFSSGWCWEILFPLKKGLDGGWEITWVISWGRFSFLSFSCKDTARHTRSLPVTSLHPFYFTLTPTWLSMAYP